MANTAGLVSVGVRVERDAIAAVDVLQALAKNNVPSAEYRTVKQAMADPQIAHRGALAEVRDAGGTFKVLNPPFRMSASRTASGPHAADLGQHSKAILAGLGFDESEIGHMTKPSGGAPTE